MRLRFARKLGLLFAVTATVAASSMVVQPAAAGAAASRWPHSVVDGFSSPSGAGFWLTYANGAVTATGGAGTHGDASNVALNGPIVGGAVSPNGKGYWLVAADGGIFTYGGARFLGSMGGAHLNEPVFSMAVTKNGKGYWLVARDGGIFTFGDAKFHGSTGNLTLTQPITGITTTPTGRGYRLIAGDGGIFNFGDAAYYGSLPGRGVQVSDVIGSASTPTGRGYWIARSNGSVYAFGDAKNFGNYHAPACDPVSAIFSNPHGQGYRLVTASGATIAFGQAPDGTEATGTPAHCVPGQGAWQVIGYSVQGRPLRAMQVGHGPRRVLWIGGIHGDEPQGSVATASLAAAFDAAGLGATTTLTILEDDNPDGRALDTRDNANGVDLNRNFPATNFDTQDPQAGGTPLSQPESRALYYLIGRVQPQLVISCHAFVGDQFVNFDGPSATIAERFSQLSGMPIRTSGELGFDTPGSLGSLMGVDRDTPILTIEFLRGSDPTADWHMIESAALSVIGS